MKTGQELHLGKYKAVFEIDDSCDSPVDGNTLGTMVTWHQNYDIGHIANPDYPKSRFKAVLMSDYLGYEEIDYPYWNTEEDEEELDRLVQENYLFKDLYIHDHGSVCVSTKPFLDPWDSGHLGFIYATKKEVRSSYQMDRQTSFSFMPTGFRDNYSLLRKEETLMLLGEEQLDREIDVYNMWSQGDTWMYFVYEIADEDGPYIESCGSLIGESEALESANEMLKCLNDSDYEGADYDQTVRCGQRLEIP